MSVNLSESVINELKALATKRGTSVTEVLRRAIGAEKFINEVQDRDEKILVENAKGEFRQIFFR